MPNDFADSLLAVRDALIDDLNAAFPELTTAKVYKTRPEIEQLEVPLGWVMLNGPITEGESSTRNLESFTVTMNLGVRYPKPPGVNVDDERIRLVSLLFDQLTATAHHADIAYVPKIVSALTGDGVLNDKYIEADVDFRFEFSARRADAV